MPEPTIEIRGLRKSFGDREALAGLGLAVEEGQTLVVFGPNGAGKTTLLRLLGTLATPTAGVIEVLGCELPREAQSLRRHIGFLGHESLLYRALSPLENLRFYGRLYGVSQLQSRCRELLGAVGMSARANDPIEELSRGMLQRVACCRALLHRPKLLLLDEPRSHLDPEAVERVEPLIGRSSGLTRVLVTHEIEWGLREADLVIGLRDGRAVLAGSVQELTVQDIESVYHRAGAIAGAGS